MGNKDIALKQFLSDNRRFAELFNNALFGGRSVIQAERLQSIDSNQSELVALRKSAIEALQKNRDVAKIYNNQMELVILGIENQNDVHYAMPMRIMVYDALTYEKQYKEIGKEHRRQKDLKGAERLSRFGKKDRLIPVVTLVVYYGSEGWDGPKNLYDMLEIPESMTEWTPIFGNYPMHLLEVQKIQDLNEYHDDLKALLGFVKYRKNLEELQAFIQSNAEFFTKVSKETFEAINTVAEVNEFKAIIPDFEKKEVVDMCEALQQLKKEGIQEGMQQGMQQGIEQTAVAMLKSKELDVFAIQRFTGLSIERLKELKRGIKQ